MRYDYGCAACDATHEISKRISQFDRKEFCPDCGSETQRKIGGFFFHGAERDDPDYHPAFGEVLTRSQAKIKAKDLGLEEVGTEDVKKHIKGPVREEYVI